ncbi:MAG: hypothetical protein WC890_00180 [Candidatus Margulisiibacteriota bacterium]
MKKNILGMIVVGLMLSFAAVSFAEAPTFPYTYAFGGMSAGFYKVGSQEVGTLNWHPDIRFGLFSFGFDVNVPFGGNSSPVGYQNFVLRNVEYNDGSKGIRYGVISTMTWGSGLLMKDYTTLNPSVVMLSNDQMGVIGYITLSDTIVKALATKTSLYGVRAEKRVNPLLTVGASFLCDHDGVLIPATGLMQKVNGLGVDASVPLPLNFNLYAELAQLMHDGIGSNGFTTGFSWGQDLLIAKANFLAEYRILDKGFAPSYFNTEYEYNPVNLTSLEATGQAKNGYLVQLNADALGLATLKAVYEQYNQSNGAFNGTLYAKLPQNIEAYGYYTQPTFVDFSSLNFEQGAILGGWLAYPVNQFTKLVINYKKAYNSSTARVEESQYYEVRFNFN